MPKGTVLFSSRAPIGYIAIALNDICTNQGFKSVVPDKKYGTYFLYYFLKNNLKNIEAMASGSTFKEISGSTMKEVPAILASLHKINEFNTICTPIFTKQEKIEKTIRILKNLKETLLPKLIATNNGSSSDKLSFMLIKILIIIFNNWQF